ncbi:MAG: H-X9-DG-CTERM domain-containing protein [Phycisphaerales bacterium]
MAEESNGRLDKTPAGKTRRGSQFSLLRVLVAVIVCVTILFCLLAPTTYPRPHKVACMVNLRTLAAYLAIYAEDHNNVYPSCDQWCDALVDAFTADDRIRDRFLCPGVKRGPCDYAMNPHAAPQQARDVVLLFESKPGWNQSGGVELLTTQNHQDKGCNVLFTDGHVEFVKTEDLGSLQWTYADANLPGNSVP